MIKIKYQLIVGCLFVSYFFNSILAAPISVIDDGGTAVVFDKPPQRIISLVPSLTESVCALGKCNNLVGVDRFSNWPKSIQGLPTLGSMGDINIERIVQLKPDLVLLDKSSSVITRLNALRITTFALDIKTMTDEHRALQKLDAVLGSSESGRVWNQIQMEITRANKQLAPSQKNIRVYFEINPASFAAGRSSFIGEILARLDLNNIIPESLGPFPKINPEFVVRSQPQVILLSETSLTQLKQRPGWGTIPAISQNKICTFNAEQNDVLVRPGPRLGEAALIISHCIQEKIPLSK